MARSCGTLDRAGHLEFSCNGCGFQVVTAASRHSGNDDPVADMHVAELHILVFQFQNRVLGDVDLILLRLVCRLATGPAATAARISAAGIATTPASPRIASAGIASAGIAPARIASPRITAAARPPVRAWAR